MSIFKTYDIRGTYPKELDEKTFYKIGQAFVKYLSTSHHSPATTHQPPLTSHQRLAVGRDVRDSSLSLSRAFIKGALSQGATIIDLGTVTVSMVYFSVNDDGLDGGAMITASHNPEEYNGVKLINKGGLPISRDSGLKEIRKLMLKKFSTCRLKKVDTHQRTKNSLANGNLILKDTSYDYANYILSFINPTSIRPLKIILDASGGVAGAIVTAIFSRLPCKITKMNFWPHDKYPDHSLNPLLEESQKSISKEIKKQKANLGVIWDGDGDRAIFFNEKGQYIPPYFMTALLVKIILEKMSGKSLGKPCLMHDCRLFWLIKEETEKYGGEFILSKAGRSFFEKEMAEGDILFAAEASGHYYFYKNFCLGDGIIPLLLVLEYLSKIKKPLSSLITPYRKKYFISKEINIPFKGVIRRLGHKFYSKKLYPQKFVNNSQINLRLSKKYQKGKISYLDGLSIEYPDWHFNLRPSKTEPLLRLNIEARSKKILEEKKKEIISLINS